MIAQKHILKSLVLLPECRRIYCPTCVSCGPVCHSYVCTGEEKGVEGRQRKS